MAELVVERGYAAVTVTEVVARAHVSKRTFYEQFAEREDCFLATYEALAEGPLQRIAAVAADPSVQDLGLRAQVERASGAYLSALAERPDLTRTLLTQIASAGPRGRAVRRQVLHRFADLMQTLAGAGHAAHPEMLPLSEDLALALVGGINELVLDALEDAVAGDAVAGTAGSGGDPIVALAGPVADLVVAVLLRPAGEAAADG